MPFADTNGMDLRSIEPRTAMWAVAEVSWEDPAGKAYLAAATLEDTSPSGACIRVKTAIAVGSTLRVKWHREQFSGIARNCRIDGRDFLLGIQRQPARTGTPAVLPPLPRVPEPAAKPADSDRTEVSWKDKGGAPHAEDAAIESDAPSWMSLRLNSPLPAGSTLHIKRRDEQLSGIVKYCRGERGTYLLGVQLETSKGHIQSAQPITSPAKALDSPSAIPGDAPKKQEFGQNAFPTPGAEIEPAPPSAPVQRTRPQTQEVSHRKERNAMRSSNLLPKFWRSLRSGSGSPHNGKSTEVPVNKLQSDVPEVPIRSQSDLLSCEDIYHASGIVSADAGYGIGKVVDMLHSKHIRDLANDVKRASVLMALDTAGTTVDDVLQDATRRQHALNSYETGQKKQLEEFEATKQRENAQLQAEMERVTAHYADRIKRNLDQVDERKDALGQWQKNKEEESQRISQAADLCAKQPALVATSEAIPALPRTHAAVGSA